MLDVHRLRLLRELSRRGTIAAVAEALSYTPSAVSQQLAVLEREAGVPLLERVGRGVRLTAAARRLVTHADAVLNELERAEAALSAARGEVTGTLRIGAFPSAARVILPPALVILGRAHPRLELTVEEIDPADAAEALRAHHLDAALTHDYDLVPVPVDAALESVVVLSEPMYLASATPPSVKTEPLSEFRTAGWVLGTPGTQCRLATERVCQTAGFQPRIRHQVNDFPTVLALVGAGQGVSVVPHLATLDAPPDITFSELPIKRRIGVTYRRGANIRPAVATFCAAVQDAVRPFVV